MMNASIEMVYATAALASIAGVGALFTGGERRVAGALVSLGALTPWIFFLQWNAQIGQSTILFLTGLFGGAPFFLVAFFVYGHGNRSPRMPIAAVWAMGGMLSSALYSLSLANLLSAME